MFEGADFSRKQKDTDKQQPTQRTIMVHGLARGGTQAVLLLGPPRQRAQS